jgi:GntR family transcriptional repressor for pyruvate dehydrogenase complex
MRDRIHAPEGYVEADIEFHRLLVSTTGNRVFLLILESINNLLLSTRQMTGARLSNARQALQEHKAILRQVEAGDPERAREEMRKHLEAFERHIRATAEDDGRHDRGRGVIPLESG